MAKALNCQAEKEHKFWEYLSSKGKRKVAFSFFLTYFGIFLFFPSLVIQHEYSLTGILLRGFTISFLLVIHTIFTLNKKTALGLITLFFSIFLFIATEKFFRVQLDQKTIDFYKMLTGWISFVSITLGLTTLYYLLVNEGQKTIQMQTTLKMAQEIHDTLVPVIEEVSEKLNIYGLSESIESMGGDLIDYISLDGKKTIYIADVSGHGVSAGIVMSMFKGAMRTMAQGKQPVEQLFTQVNHALTPIKKKNMFLTAAGITFDDTTSTATISTAGHLPVLHFSNKTNGFYRHHIKQVPVGVTANTEYKGLSVPYDTGDYFVLLTDGLTENMENFDNLAMLSHIEDTLTPKLSLEESLDKISKELFEDMKKQGEPIDDRSIIIIKCI